jgi:hypothetical protein
MSQGYENRFQTHWVLNKLCVGGGGGRQQYVCVTRLRETAPFMEAPLVTVPGFQLVDSVHLPPMFMHVSSALRLSSSLSNRL